MRYKVRPIVLLSLFCLWVGSLAVNGLAQKTPQPTDGQPQKPQPMVIKSDSLVVDDANKLITFSGRVNAKRDDFTIMCEKMFVYYESTGTGEDSRSPNTVAVGSGDTIGSRITKIVADGKVKIIRKSGGEALARHAEYYEGQDKIVLTGDPMVKQGEDFVQGSKIIIFLRENRSIVEGSEQKRVKAVIYPKKETK